MEKVNEWECVRKEPVIEWGEDFLLCYIIANKEKFGYVKVIPFSCGSCDMLGFKKDGAFEYVEIEMASWKYTSHKHHPKYGIYLYNADRIIALYGKAEEVDGVPVSYINIDDYNEYYRLPKEAIERRRRNTIVGWRKRKAHIIQIRKHSANPTTVY